jgi:hypothetical protein
MRKHWMMWMSVCVLWLQGSWVLGQGLIIDHHCTDLSQVPTAYLDSAKAQFRMTYGHTSHGSQIISGMEILRNHDSRFDFFNDYYHYRFGPPNPLAPDGDLSLWDYVPDGDLGAPDRTTWAAATRAMLLNSGGNYVVYPHRRNLVMWSWCGQVSWALVADIDLYLSLMNQLEADFPDVTFVYMTGHLDGTGTAGNLFQRDEQIRNYCRTNHKVLFDFADIESYDPDGNGYVSRGATDNCDYSGGNWAQQWCAAHPGDPLCEDCSCAHSQSLNCNRKARAFWYMLARLAGWPGATPQHVSIICEGGMIALYWEPVAGATSYRVLSSENPESGYTEDMNGTFDGTTWTSAASTDRRFYMVTAITE